MYKFDFKKLDFELAFVSARPKFFLHNRQIKHKKGIYVAIELLLKIGSLAAQKISELIFVLSPSKSDFNYSLKNQDYDDLFKKNGPEKTYAYNKLSQSLIQNIFKQTQFPYLDFYQVVKNQGWNVENLYLPNDNDHLSPLGLKYMAKAINDHFLNRSVN